MFFFFVFEKKKKIKKKNLHHRIVPSEEKKGQGAKGKMNSAGRIVILTLAILITIALLAITISFCVLPKKTTVGPEQPIQNPNLAIPSNINQAYANSEFGSFQLHDEKAFVVRTRRQSPVYNALNFSNLQFTNVTAQTSTGFQFVVTQSQVVVALQGLDQYFASGSRQVGIFEIGTRTLLISAFVSKTNDGLVDGFRTHALLSQEQVTLYPGVLYACIGFLEIGDFRTLENADNGLFTNNIGFKGTCGFSSPVFALPTASCPQDSYVTSPFPGFQLRSLTPQSAVPTFQIDSQYPSFPVNYIANLNYTVLNDGTGLNVDAGLCAAFGGVYNIVLFNPIRFIPVGQLFSPNTWYGVYVMQSMLNPSDQQLLLSANFPEPTLSLEQTKTVVARRIGFVQTDSTNKLIPITQYGPETRRTSTFTNPTSTTLSLANNAVTTLSLEMIAPTSNMLTLQVELTFNAEPSLPAVQLHFGNAQSLLFAPDQNYQIAQITIIPDVSLIPRALTVECVFDTLISTQIPKLTFSVLDFTEDI